MSIKDANKGIYDQILNADIATPYYVVSEELLRKNLSLLKRVIDSTGCKILLAQKGFSMFSMYPMISEYLSGTTASSLYEAKLGAEEMQAGETHIFAPAFRDDDFDEILSIVDHIVFNSFTQWERYRHRVKLCGRQIDCGIRINPEYSEQETAIYDPCAAGSRLGVRLPVFEEEAADGGLEGIDGLHFHTMCEQNSDTLERTLEYVEAKFGKYLELPQIKWLNMGGGHHVTRPDYDVDLLISCINKIKQKYNVQVYIEPGEAVALNTGFLVSTVLDLVQNDIDIAIIDASAACHMPDVLEMPYRPEIVGADKPGVKPYTYRLGAHTCLAGDIVGDYSFDTPLKIGDKLIFCDMAHYSMVKNNTFNGIGLPSIAVCSEKGGVKLVRRFGYQDFKERLS